MKSIKLKILVFMLSIITIALLLAGGVSSYINYKSTLETLEHTMSEAAEIAAARVTAELKVYRFLIKEMANVIVEGGMITEGQREKAAKENNFLSFSVASKGGLTTSGKDISEHEYFMKCQETMVSYISDPIIDKEKDSIVIIIAAPVLYGERFDGIVFAEIDGSFLSDIAASISIGTGNGAILNKEGNTIGFADRQMVLDEYNTQLEAKKDPRLNKLANIEADMMKGNVGFDDYSYDGVKKFMAYAPIPETEGWSLDVSVLQKEFLKNTYEGILYIFLISIGIILVASIIIIRLAGSISSPIKKCVLRIEQLSNGDLKTEVPVVIAKDETGILAKATQKLVKDLDFIISDTGYLLNEMAEGNFALITKAEDNYIGDFKKLKDSIFGINKSLSKTLQQINEAANQVSGGSEQLSAGAQSLSQGVTEQAATIEELSATITEISQQIKNNAQYAHQANERASSVGDEMKISNDKMKKMVEAITEISVSSGEIGKIIKTIEDIAFQTNILALNAAVEAARAGTAGKGFAVVADEVRNLASKSEVASKNTSALIESSIRSVEKGTSIASDTAMALLDAVKGSEEVESILDKISMASGEQADNIAQVTQGIDQISSIVQTNSATAEQSAAASEELSAQAQMLKELVNNFHLSKDTESYSFSDTHVLGINMGKY